MVNIRAIQKKARGRISEHAGIPVYCFAEGEFKQYTKTTARIHTKSAVLNAVGDEGSEFQSSVEIQPTLVFLCDEKNPYEPDENHACIVDENEGYYVNLVEDIDVNELTARCVPMSKENIKKYNIPRIY